MRYKINFDKTLNEIVPWYIAGRRLMLMVSACFKPLQSLNDSFAIWARETRIEASMTSQVFKLEWFLNRKFAKYFSEDGVRVSIKDKTDIGVPIYAQDVDIHGIEHIVFYQESELESSNTTILNHEGEQNDETTYSFIVYSPEPDEKLISKKEYESILKFYINKYKISGKTFIIKYIDNERI